MHVLISNPDLALSEYFLTRTVIGLMLSVSHIFDTYTLVCNYDIHVIC